MSRYKRCNCCHYLHQKPTKANGITPAYAPKIEVLLRRRFFYFPICPLTLASGTICNTPCLSFPFVGFAEGKPQGWGLGLNYPFTLSPLPSAFVSSRKVDPWSSREDPVVCAALIEANVYIELDDVLEAERQFWKVDLFCVCFVFVCRYSSSTSTPSFTVFFLVLTFRTIVFFGGTWAFG